MEETKMKHEAWEFIFYHANSVKNEPYILEMKVRIQNGDVEFNILKEWRRLRVEYNMFPQYPPLGKLHWLLVNYIFGKPKRLKAIIESDINTKPIGDIFLNSVKSQEAIIFYMLDKGLLDIVNFKEEIEIFKIGFPDDKVVKFSERALIKYLISRTTSKTPPIIRSFTTDQLKQLYTGLTAGGFLTIDTDRKAFDYVFGACDKPKDFKGLNWLQGRQYLRELLTPIKHPDVKIADLERAVPLYFICKGKMAVLPNDRPYPERPYSKAIVRILKVATL